MKDCLLLVERGSSKRCSTKILGPNESERDSLQHLDGKRSRSLPAGTSALTIARLARSPLTDITSRLRADLFVS